MHRRDFLRNTVGAISGAAVPNIQPIARQLKGESDCSRFPTYGATLAASADLELLGIPRSWWSVQHGLHPFTPERTLILPDRPKPLRNHSINSLTERLSDELTRDRHFHHKTGISQLIYATSLLTQTYGVPDKLESWSRRYLNWLHHFHRSVAQDSLWVCPEAWQYWGETVKTMNGVVDWWLILVPGGIENVSIDGTRLHVLITPVYSHMGTPRRPVEHWDLMARSLSVRGDAPISTIDSTWLNVARMDRTSACQLLNERITNCLGQQS